MLKIRYYNEYQDFNLCTRHTFKHLVASGYMEKAAKEMIGAEFYVSLLTSFLNSSKYFDFIQIFISVKCISICMEYIEYKEKVKI